MNLEISSSSSLEFLYVEPSKRLKLSLVDLFEEEFTLAKGSFSFPVDKNFSYPNSKPSIKPDPLNYW